MRDDLDALLVEFFAACCRGVHGQAGQRVPTLFEVLVRDEQLGDEVAGVAVDGRDADVARHDGYRVLSTHA